MSGILKITNLAVMALLAGQSMANLNLMARITPAPTGYSACEDIYISSAACSYVIPNFDYLSFSRQAACLCYDANADFDPSAFDGPFSNCAGYISTESPGYFSSLTAGVSGDFPSRPCATLGDLYGSVYGGGNPSSSATDAGGILRSTSFPVTDSSAVVSVVTVFDGGASTTSQRGFQVSSTTPTPTTTQHTQTPGVTSAIKPLGGDAPARLAQVGTGLCGLILALAVYL